MDRGLEGPLVRLIRNEKEKKKKMKKGKGKSSVSFLPWSATVPPPSGTPTGRPALLHFPFPGG
jgi:hypothetical protein